jgi:hypothetical protein
MKPLTQQGSMMQGDSHKRAVKLCFGRPQLESHFCLFAVCTPRRPCLVVFRDLFAFPRVQPMLLVYP